jgi:molecular chaperone DnaK
MNAKRVFGIDLGTTYSCIAHVDEHGKPAVLPSSEGEATTPSVVFFESADNIVVGQPAKEMVAIYPDLTVSTVKRAMGDPHWQRTFWGESYRPQSISSFVLRKLARDAELQTGEKVEDVVITCPAYFGINEKEATKQAGVLAGLNVLYVIPEPTAAALAYGIEQTQDQTVMVYDLGGGTFDVTLIQIQGGDITVVSTGGDHQLGGKDWDDAIVSFFVQRFEEQTGTPGDQLLEDTEAYAELLSAAERAKKTLSSRQAITEAIRFGSDRVKVELTREQFDQITSSYLERTLLLTDQELEKARGKGITQIDKLLLVGGSTYMPQVIEAVKSRYPFEVVQFDPNQAVAKGAAIFGYKCFLEEAVRIHVAEATGAAPEKVDLEQVPERVLEQAQAEVAQQQGLPVLRLRGLVERRITNVTSKSFGLIVINEQDREVVTNLITLDSKVPASLSDRFGTYRDGQTGVEIRCVENRQTGRQDIEVDQCQLVGTAELRFTRALPAGSPIEIRFDLGPDGLLKVFGKDLTTGGAIDAEFRTESILSREELAEEAGKHLTKTVA